MGADAFIALYGLRFVLSDDELDAVERRQDPRIIGARQANLQTYFGRLTDGEPHFLLVGTKLGVFGVENESQSSFDSGEFDRIVRETNSKLAAAGLSGKPKLHFQLDAQY